MRCLLNPVSAALASSFRMDSISTFYITLKALRSPPCDEASPPSPGARRRAPLGIAAPAPLSSRSRFPPCAESFRQSPSPLSRKNSVKHLWSFGRAEDSALALVPCPWRETRCPCRLPWGRIEEGKAGWVQGSACRESTTADWKSFAATPWDAPTHHQRRSTTNTCRIRHASHDTHQGDAEVFAHAPTIRKFLHR
jgi:hypothetical protein